MRPVRIYTTNYCGYCTRAKDFLRKKGVAFEEIDVTGNDAVRAELVERTGRRTVPQIFIGDESVGGYTDIVQLESEGRLDAMLRA